MIIRCTIIYTVVILRQNYRNMSINEIFGRNVKAHRLSLKLSQEALANLAEIDRTYLPKVEKGERNVSLAIAQKIANALNVKLSKLLEGE